MADSDRMDLAEKAFPGLTFDQAHAYFIVGHSLQSLYQGLLNMPVPEHLKAIVDKLEERHPSVQG